MIDRNRHSDEYDPEPADRPSAEEVSLDPVTRADNFRAGQRRDMELAVLAALALKFTDFLKFVRVKDWNSVSTQAAVWVSGVVAVFLGSAADISAGVEVFGSFLGDLDIVSQILTGLSLGSVGSVLYDFKSALDGTDSAVTPPLTNLSGGADGSTYRHVGP